MRISALVAALAATVAAGSIAAPASAHELHHSRSFSKMTLSEIERYQERTIRHDYSTIRYWQKNLCTRFVGKPRILSSVRLLTTGAQCETRRRDLRFHRAQLAWETREFAKTRSRIAALRRRSSPSPVYSGGGHVAFWLCVHSREGAWNAQTGNGYYGGLQMTYGWNGLVANAALLSPGQQIAAAEEGFRRSGYSVEWLRGQWPNTAPPCLYLL